jgi:hypothetical protein
LMSINNRQPLRTADCRHMRELPQMAFRPSSGSDHGLNNAAGP